MNRFDLRYFNKDTKNKIEIKNFMQKKNVSNISNSKRYFALGLQINLVTLYNQNNVYIFYSNRRMNASDCRDDNKTINGEIGQIMCQPACGDENAYSTQCSTEWPLDSAYEFLLLNINNK